MKKISLFLCLLIHSIITHTSSPSIKKPVKRPAEELSGQTLHAQAFKKSAIAASSSSSSAAAKEAAAVCISSVTTPASLDAELNDTIIFVEKKGIKKYCYWRRGEKISLLDVTPHTFKQLYDNAKTTFEKLEICDRLLDSHDFDLLSFRTRLAQDKEKKGKEDSSDTLERIMHQGRLIVRLQERILLDIPKPQDARDFDALNDKINFTQENLRLMLFNASKQCKKTNEEFRAIMQAARKTYDTMMVKKAEDEAAQLKAEKAQQEANEELLQACVNGNYEAAMQAIRDGANINHCEIRNQKLWTPFKYAVYYGHEALIRECIKRNATPLLSSVLGKNEHDVSSVANTKEFKAIPEYKKLLQELNEYIQEFKKKRH
jgi:hypothetical protein